MRLLDLPSFRHWAQQKELAWETGQIGPSFGPADEEATWGMAASAEPLAAFDERLRRLGWAWLRDRKRNQWTWPFPNLA